MTPEDARDNVLELVELLSAQRTMTVREACQIHQAAGLLDVYDSALPQWWYEKYVSRHEHPPVGFVWAYDGSTLGRPYPLTKSAAATL